MKRRSIVGLSVTILVLSIIIGIASLPDEVLIESSTTDNSPTLPEEIIAPTKEVQETITEISDNKNTDIAKAEIDALKKEITELKNEVGQIKTDSKDPQDIPKITEEKDTTVKNSDDVSQGKVITVNISDGVGSKSR
jgi:uncharacterized membrane protein (DUF106 family)